MCMCVCGCVHSNNNYSSSAAFFLLRRAKMVVIIHIHMCYPTSHPSGILLCGGMMLCVCR